MATSIDRPEVARRRHVGLKRQGEKAGSSSHVLLLDLRWTTNSELSLTLSGEREFKVGIEAVASLAMNFFFGS